MTEMLDIFWLKSPATELILLTESLFEFESL